MIINNNGDISIHRNLSVGYLETGLTADIHLNGWLYSQKGVVANAGTHNWGVLHYQLHSQNKNRFSIGLNTEETGNNQGANFSIWRYNDDGSFLSHALTITRVNGNVGIGTNTPTEKLQIGDRFAIHDGGWKAILYNSTWNESLGFNTRNTNGSASALYFTDGGNVFFQTAPSGNAGTILNDAVQSLVVYNSGQIGIGTNHALTSLGDASTKLFIAGGVRARKIKVDQANWADFVFDNDYKLPTLAEVENYIRTHKHLKGVPTEKEVVKEGLDLGQTQAVLLQKIEELTLYIIEQNKKIEQLEKLRKEVEELKQILTSK
ncbi:hypothetical protein [Lacibacter sp.]|uniref:hypothetical protein n=1 Tax=Lacibacter sp. TaxID=1915409 RepID=UPI002B4B5C73|nr:hypothetical protein [Lacibacter sp.]HLP39527.1 hypothetical protein [Lacibacter sp.]